MLCCINKSQCVILSQDILLRNKSQCVILSQDALLYKQESVCNIVSGYFV